MATSMTPDDSTTTLSPNSHISIVAVSTRLKERTLRLYSSVEIGTNSHVLFRSSAHCPTAAFWVTPWTGFRLDRRQADDALTHRTGPLAVMAN